MVIISTRNTVQGLLVYETVMSMYNHPTADAVYEAVREKCPTISKGTVYRNLNRLAEEGKILRVSVANKADRFDRTLSIHCHFLCKACGNVTDYPLNVDLKSLFVKGEITEYEIVLHGICEDCATK